MDLIINFDFLISEWTGYDWHYGKLDPSIMNVNQGQNEMLPHLIQVLISLS